MIPNSSHQSGLEDQANGMGQRMTNPQSSGKAKADSGVEKAGARDTRTKNDEKAVRNQLY